MKDKVSTEICLRGGVLGEGAVLSKNEVFFTKKLRVGVFLPRVFFLCLMARHAGFFCMRAHMALPSVIPSFILFC